MEVFLAIIVIVVMIVLANIKGNTAVSSCREMLLRAARQNDYAMFERIARRYGRNKTESAINSMSASERAEVEQACQRWLFRW